jgi:ABC-type transport system substrate-binding protein
MSTQFESGSQDVVYAPALTDAARLKQTPSNQVVINYQLGSFFYMNANNFSGFKEDTYSQLLTAASTEPDAGVRKQLYSQLNEYLLDQCCTFAFSLYPSIIIAGQKLHDLQVDPSAVLAYVDAWVG